MTNNIKESVSRRIAALRWTDQLEQSVLQTIRGQTAHPSRRRLALAITFTLVLVSVTASALLFNWHPFGEKVLVLGNARDGFATWSLENETALVKEMEAAGRDTSAFPDVQGKSEKDANAALTSALDKAWSGEHAWASMNILENVLGHFDTWSLTDKAWLSVQLDKNVLLTDTDEVNVLPSGSDMSEQTVLNNGKAMVLAAYGHVKREELDSLIPCLSFYYHQTNPAQRFWQVNFRNALQEVVYSVVFEANGSNPVVKREPTDEEFTQQQSQHDKEVLEQAALIEKMEAEKGPMAYWPLEDKAFIDGHSVPTADEIQVDQAVQIAVEALKEKYVFSQSEIEGMPMGMFFVDLTGTERRYSINFDAGNHQPNDSVAIDAKTGEVLAVYGPDNVNG